MTERTELNISTIGDLQLALIENDNSAIKRYIEHIDRETANAAIQQAGEHFGFPTVEIEGVFRTSSGHLARVFGYKRSDFLVKLLKRYGISGVNIAGFRHDGGIKIHESLELNPQDHKSILYDWPAFLIGGMNSTNEEAQAVQGYLLKAERVARISIVAIKKGQVANGFPDPATGAVMAKLANFAWRGNPIASYILENTYNVPVGQLLHQTDPLLSETSGTISQYLHFICTDNMTGHGLKVVKTNKGYAVTGTPELFHRSFIEAARKHHLTQFFSSVVSLGAIIARETDALELLGWRRTARKVQGYHHYTYEYTPIEEETEN
ncbi:MAG: hypothetical protein OEV28_08495 [Nitrospirota bacterium]|nr:hypothetical protein [Nitrospirota bacterium]